jgi:uroporphyrinogen decarboxylase
VNSKERFLAACRGEAVDRPPVWIMRQAGRALPEYNALREKHSFWELCATPELAAAVSLQPIKRFDLDAVIIFSDILVIPAAMGMDVEFSSGIKLDPPIRSGREVAKLRSSGVTRDLEYVAKALQNTYREIKDDIALLGFSGAPYTLACYMVEGGSSKTFHAIKSLMHKDPGLFEELMEKLTEVVIEYLKMQIDSSVTAVQLFDTWAADLAPEDFKRFVLPYVTRIIEKLSPEGVPVIYYINGIGNLLELAGRSGADVLGIDWRIRLSDVRKRLGEKQVVQGNLDPSILFAPEEVIREKVFQMLDETNGTGHIVNLGHGLNPETPLEGIQTFIKSVSDWADEKNG